jgi:hypothetical protein
MVVGVYPIRSVMSSKSKEEQGKSMRDAGTARAEMPTVIVKMEQKTFCSCR